MTYTYGGLDCRAGPRVCVLPRANRHLTVRVFCRNDTRSRVCADSTIFLVRFIEMDLLTLISDNEDNWSWI
jgi:hypothetical protein